MDWQTFFDFGDGRVRQNKKIDTKLSTVLFDLMGKPEGEPTSLASRNFVRNLAMKVAGYKNWIAVLDLVFAAGRATAINYSSPLTSPRFQGGLACSPPRMQ